MSTYIPTAAEIAAADATERRTDKLWAAAFSTMIVAVTMSIAAAVIKLIAPDSPLLPATIATGAALTVVHLVVALTYAARVREWMFVTLTYFAVAAAVIPLLYAIFGPALFEARF